MKTIGPEGTDVSDEYVQNMLIHLQQLRGIETESHRARWGVLDLTIPAQRAELKRRVMLFVNSGDTAMASDMRVKNMHAFAKEHL